MLRLVEKRATSMWWAFAEVCTQVEFDRISAFRGFWDPDFDEPRWEDEFSYQEVVDALVATGLPLRAARLGFVWREDQGLVRRKVVFTHVFDHGLGPVGNRTIVLAPNDDLGRQRPCWCPAIAVRLGGVQEPLARDQVPWMPDPVVDRPINMEEAPWEAFLADLANFLDPQWEQEEPPLQPEDPHDAEPLEDLAAMLEEGPEHVYQHVQHPMEGRYRVNRALIGRADFVHPLEGVYRVVGVYPPPYMRSSRYFMGPAVTFHRIEDPTVPCLDAGELVVSQGFPTALDRAVARSTGKGGIAWELRPCVLANMQISSRHLVYVVDFVNAVPCAETLAILGSGDFNPATFGKITTCTGVFSLVDPVELIWSEMGLKYTFFRLLRNAATLLGAVARAVPFHLEDVTGHTTRLLNVQYLPNREVFPDEATYLRTRFAIIAQYLPENLRGMFLEVRNSVMAMLQDPQKAQALQAMRFDPFEVARTIIEQDRLLAGQMGGCPRPLRV